MLTVNWNTLQVHGRPHKALFNYIRLMKNTLRLNLPAIRGEERLFCAAGELQLVYWFASILDDTTTTDQQNQQLPQSMAHD